MRALLPLMLLVLLATACSSGDSEKKGVCVGKGWKDTCHYFASCNTGQYELECGYGDAGPDECVCIHDDKIGKTVPKQTVFCNSPDAGSEKYDQGLSAMASACGFDIAP